MIPPETARLFTKCKNSFYLHIRPPLPLYVTFSNDQNYSYRFALYDKGKLVYHVYVESSRLPPIRGLK